MAELETTYELDILSEEYAQPQESGTYNGSSPLPPTEARERVSRPSRGTQETAVHPVVGEIAIGAVVWFIVVMWLAFARGPEVDYLLVIVTLFFVMFFTLFLLTASYGWKDPRWHVPETTFARFLQSDVRTATGAMRGRDVLIEIATLPVSLAVGAMLLCELTLGDRRRPSSDWIWKRVGRGLAPRLFDLVPS
jgi:hypothetical protein